MIAGNAIYGLCKDSERGAEVYCSANSKDQAKIIFEECKSQVEVSPVLRKHLRTTVQGVFHDSTKSKLQPLSSETKNLDGKNVHIAIFDEIHEYRDYKIIHAIKGKTKKRKQPLTLYITTLGTVIDGPLMDLYTLGCRILDRERAISRLVSDSYFVYIDEIDEGDDIDDVKCWYKANPSLGTLLDLDELKIAWARAKLTPSERNNFINKQLNVFTQVDELSFLDARTIRKNNHTKPIEELIGLKCYGGFDLAETEDFTSANLEFPLPDNWFFVLEHSWVPKKKMQDDNEKLDWEYLQEMGWLTVVDNDYVEYEKVLEWFKEQREHYFIDTVGYDPAKAFMMVNSMTEAGFTMNAVRPGEITLTGPLDHLKERFIDGKIIHNNNAMFNFYLGNVKLTKRSVNATYLPTKMNKYRKIDGFMSLLTSHTEYLRAHPVTIPQDKKLTTVIDLTL